MVYNRFGQRLFYGRDMNDKWDGRFNGKPQDPGTYVWQLSYTSMVTGEKVFKKGTTILMR